MSRELYYVWRNWWENNLLFKFQNKGRDSSLALVGAFALLSSGGSSIDIKC